MEWTASVPTAATSNGSAPKPPNNPVGLLHPKDSKDEGDVPMREVTEETKEKKQPAAHNGKKQSKNKDRSVHWGEDVVQEVGNDRKNNKHSKGLKETQQEMIWVPKVTTDETTAATAKAPAVKTPGVTEAPNPTKQKNTTSQAKTTGGTERTTATTATHQEPKKSATTEAPKKATKEAKQQLPVQPT
jgi:hypothetical protein